MPIVIHDAATVMGARGSRLVRRGTVHVTVLPPVPTAGWAARDVADAAAATRRLYEATLVAGWAAGS